MRVVCDFDGTITRKDTTDLVLAALARPEWEDLEADWLAGRITAAQCMRGQVALIEASDEALDAVLDAAELDPGFARFAAWCEQRGAPLSIVSDGVDYFIRRILGRDDLDAIPTIANRLAGDAIARRLEQPWAREGCAAGSGVCKCAVAAPVGGGVQTLIYVGDGRSDFCVSGRADILFAKGALADYAAARGRPFHPFTTFDDVTEVLARLIGASEAVSVTRPAI
jgi:2-hydroxy-3-keto-5-methylthiopentenyl-1-phosphate phosphatase